MPFSARAFHARAGPNGPNRPTGDTGDDIIPAVTRPGSALVPLLRFHFAVGARLAMRALVPMIAAAFGAGMLLGTDFVTSMARVLFGERASGGSAVLLAA